MALAAKVEPIDKDVDLAIDQTLSPEAQAKILAEEARGLINEAADINRRALGRIILPRIYVDGQQTAQLERVRPNGVIIAEFDLIVEALQWISRELTLVSPVLSGRYAKSHALFADGQEVEVDAHVPPDASEYVFMNTQPYARKIERGLSSKAPDGVYQVVAALASRRFGNLARITYGFRTAIGGRFILGRAGNRASDRNPAIVIRMRG